MTRASARGPWVIWGGLLPSGSLKYLTFRSYLGAVGEHSLQRGLIEISEGCTALALEYLAERARTPLVVVCTPAGERKLRARGFRAETLLPASLEDALAICAARRSDGWHWPEQMSNPLLLDAVLDWAPQVASLLRGSPEVDTVACGFGTGATVAGLERALAPLGYRVIGVESAPGMPISGWRNYSEQNLGTRDLFHQHRQRIELQTYRQVFARSVTPLEALLAHDFGVDPARVCVISHDGVPG
jgi:S-sulfo-L-cysteine synthase (O-acetyl-L-serine-dependent)